MPPISRPAAWQPTPAPQAQPQRIDRRQIEKVSASAVTASTTNANKSPVTNQGNISHVDALTKEVQMNRLARCHRGLLRANASGGPLLVNICHCRDWKRRTGAIAGSGARKLDVTIKGIARPSSGMRKTGVGFDFICQNCGTSLYWGENCGLTARRNRNAGSARRRHSLVWNRVTLSAVSIKQCR